MTKVERAVFGIDQELLKSQRAWLLEQAMNGSEEADGLMNMIDAILDAAWDDGILPEANGESDDVEYAEWRKVHGYEDE